MNKVTKIKELEDKLAKLTKENIFHVKHIALLENTIHLLHLARKCK